MLELGDIPVLSVHLAVVDPDGAPKSLKENKYQLPTPEPEPLESLRKQGRLRGDIIVFNGDGDFTLDTWVQYQENPEDFEDNGEDYQDEDDDEGGEDDEVSSSPLSLHPSLSLSLHLSLPRSCPPLPPSLFSFLLSLSLPPSLFLTFCRSLSYLARPLALYICI